MSRAVEVLRSAEILAVCLFASHPVDRAQQPNPSTGSGLSPGKSVTPSV
jgi:hypothetical protein